MAEATFPLASTGTTPGASTDPGGDRIGSGLTDADGIAAGMIADHCAEALDQLLEVHKGKPRLEDFLCTLADQATDLETALWDLYTKRVLDQAEGVQLDGLGAIVGEPRKDRTDSAYRVYIRVRILVNRSDGQIDDLYAILRQAFSDPAVDAKITEHFPAAIQVELVEDLAAAGLSPVDMVAYIRDAKAAAVTLDFVYIVTPDVETLEWGSTADPLLGGEWGSTTDPTLGDSWAGVAR